MKTNPWKAMFNKIGHKKRNNFNNIYYKLDPESIFSANKFNQSDK